MTNASFDLLRRYPSGHVLSVTVDRAIKRTRTGDMHKGSRAAVIREARLKAPQFKDAAATEVFYGSIESTDTVVIFDPKQPASWGF